MLTFVDITSFQNIVREYYRLNRRAMPWRDHITPYGVFISEVMLQQTQVTRVMDVFPRFIKVFPDFKALANASFSAVLQEWQGMGYNRRALYLHKAAAFIMRDWSGSLSCNISDLESLPGIGPATARSIAVFAWNIPHAFIETNIRSVFLHHFFPRAADVSDSRIMPFVEEALDRVNPREWHYALMDYGTMIKKAYPNPSRRSAHYTKQKKFAGSLREARGMVLRLLSSSPRTAAFLARHASITSTRMQTALSGLVRDGIVKRRGRSFHIA